MLSALSAELETTRGAFWGSLDHDDEGEQYLSIFSRWGDGAALGAATCLGAGRLALVINHALKTVEFASEAHLMAFLLGGGADCMLHMPKRRAVGGASGGMNAQRGRSTQGLHGV
jgi:hypothetical protein